MQKKKSICPWTGKIFGMHFFTRPPDLEFFIKIISHYAPGLRKKLNQNFFTMLQDFFFKNLFTMLLDLKFILVQKYLHHASGLGKIF